MQKEKGKEQGDNGGRNGSVGRGMTLLRLEPAFTEP